MKKQYDDKKRAPQKKGKRIIKKKKLNHLRIIIQSKHIKIKEQMKDDDVSTLHSLNEEGQSYQMLENSNAQKAIFYFILDLFRRSGAHFTTFILALEILIRINLSNIRKRNCKILAAVIFNIALKFDQNSAVTLTDLVIWSEYTFSKNEIIQFEAIILECLSFQVPYQTFGCDQELNKTFYDTISFIFEIVK